VADPTIEEEACADARITAAINASGGMTIQKTGHGSIDPMLLVDILQSARKVGASVLQRMGELLQTEDKLPPSKRNVGFMRSNLK